MAVDAMTPGAFAKLVARAVMLGAKQARAGEYLAPDTLAERLRISDCRVAHLRALHEAFRGGYFQATYRKSMPM